MTRSQPHAPPKNSSPSGHLVVLTISIAILALSCLLQAPDEQRVTLPGGFSLPGLCLFRRIFGLDCPGCGTTRCFISLAHGEWSRAWEFNAAGVLFFALVVVQVPYRAVQLSRVRRGLAPIELGPWGMAPLISVAGLMLLQWLVKVASQAWD